MTEEGLNQEAINARPINCDQVSWLLDIFNRYLPQNNHPRVSQERPMLTYAMLYEVMDIAGLIFEDENARWNGTPNQARPYPDQGILSNCQTKNNPPPHD